MGGGHAPQGVGDSLARLTWVAERTSEVSVGDCRRLVSKVKGNFI